MRLIRLLIALACIAAGATIGALNPQTLSIDIGFAIVHATLGVAILAALLIGAIIGGSMLAFSVVLPLRHRLRRSQPPPATTLPPPPVPPVDGI